MEKFKVTFQPEGRTVEVEKDRTILSAALSAGVFINSSCGGDGVCGRCKVIVTRGKVFSQPTAMLSPEEKRGGVHLACITSVIEDIEVKVPVESRVDFEALSAQEIQQRLSGISVAPEDIQVVELKKKEYPPAPLVRKVFVQLEAPTDNDNISDLDRISRHIARSEGIADVQTALVNVRGLGKILRDSDWKVTVTLARRGKAYEMLAIEPGDTAGKNLGFAFDIGTTTVSGQLIDLTSGTVLGTKATYNQQAVFGADVITRIIYAEKEEGLEQLHSAVVACMNDIIRGLTGEHAVDLNDISSVVCTGNTTMIHLLLRIDPSFIRRQPYVPTANLVPALRAQEAGLKLNPKALVFCAPGISSYVGGDVVSGVLAIGQDTM